MRTGSQGQGWQPGDLADDERRLLRLFRCLDAAERSEVLRGVGERLAARSTLDPYLKMRSDPQHALQEELTEELDGRLLSTRPSGTWLVELMDYDYHIEKWAWTEAGNELAEVILGTAEFDDQYVEDLVDAYLQGAEEYHVPLLADFGVTEEEMLEVLRSEAQKFIHDWRENVVLLLEKQAGAGER